MDPHDQQPGATGPANTLTDPTPMCGNTSSDTASPSSGHATPSQRSKRKKVVQACVYCRRSHMTCDEGRPCQRCIKRHIGHKCHDEPTKAAPRSSRRKSGPSASQSISPQTTPGMPLQPDQMQNYLQNLVPYPISGFTFASPQVGAEYSMFSNVLRNLDPQNPHFALVNQLCSDPNVSQPLAPLPQAQGPDQPQLLPPSGLPAGQMAAPIGTPVGNPVPQIPTSHPVPLSTSTATFDHRPYPVTTQERFFLTAADPSDVTSEGRLRQVINAKYEAGLLKPYNYVNGYARLQTYMEKHMTKAGQARVLAVLGTFRPEFRSVAQKLTDFDLLVVEEMFERSLLDYDRVFSSMGVPACLWRRTGEIYKANKEFANLIKVPLDQLREGKLSIYELMLEESAVNYWEKYGNIAFDSSQKAVLTSCILRHPSAHARTKSSPGQVHYNSMVFNHTQQAAEPLTNGGASSNRLRSPPIPCCFSFTIRRDRYDIPLVIVGNFIPVRPQ
ncbi:Transcription factor [Dimargaris verticillata]|uniref:Transcription factor n=1 Tax=Dimargaris verticillata TaxID=2761393 RepID=A0A9W8B1X8_9FUNG|nr:Transcription factor [Dimargaris verticillata]